MALVEKTNARNLGSGCLPFGALAGPLPQSNVRPGYRSEIDGLRGVAVLLVLAFHVFPDWVSGGYIGVDIFFVISGFLISTIVLKSLDRGGFSYIEFYSGRIRRIFPALIVILFASLIFGWFTLNPIEYKVLGRNIAGGAAFISNFVTLKESGYFDAAADSKPLLHLWSLGIEEQFYIFWPFLLAFLCRRRIAWSGLCALTVFSFLLNMLLIGFKPVATFYLPITRFWELAVGGVLAYLSHRRDEPIPIVARSLGIQNPNTLGLIYELHAWIGVLLIVVGLSFTSNDSFPGWRAVLPTAGAALLIAAGPKARLNRLALSNPALVGVGMISYPLYLWHWPLLVSERFLQLDVNSLGARLGVVALSFLAASLTYVFLERPLRFGRLKEFFLAPIALAGAMLLLCLTGLLVEKNEPLLSRFRYPAPVLSAIGQFTFDMEKEFRSEACLLNPDQSYKDFSPECDDGDLEQRSIMIWGDSHAAALYPAIKRLKLQNEARLRIIQYTTSACLPILGMSVGARKYCKDNNDFVFRKIESLKPDFIVMTGSWIAYSGVNPWPKMDFAALRRTVERVRTVGSRIIVLGNVPAWDAEQPTIVWDVWRRYGQLRNRTRLHLRDDSIQMDLQVQNAVSGLGVSFISPVKKLCNAEGCLIFTDADIKFPVYAASNHLSADGAGVVLEDAIPEMLRN